MSALEMFVAAARKFVGKVEGGQARSQVTYTELKAALEVYEAEPTDSTSQQLAALREQIAGLVEQGYVQHKEACDMVRLQWALMDPEENVQCSCGLSSLLSTLTEETTE